MLTWRQHDGAGEMVFPWMFEEFAALQPVKEAAEILAKKADWPKLYDLETLESNSVPVAGATYYEDMYVDFELAQVNPQTLYRVDIRAIQICSRPCRRSL